MQGKLDLYHALVVTYIVFFFGTIFLFGMDLHPFNHHSQELTGKWVGERRFVWSSRTNFEMFIYLLMDAFGVIVFFFWFLYLAIDIRTFGSQPSCNDLVNFVLFFATVRATVTWLRVMTIVFLAVTTPLCLFLLGFLIIAPSEWTQACTNALQKVYDRIPRLGVVRYVIGIP